MMAEEKLRQPLFIKLTTVHPCPNLLNTLALRIGGVGRGKGQMREDRQCSGVHFLSSPPPPPTNLMPATQARLLSLLPCIWSERNKLN